MNIRTMAFVFVMVCVPALATNRDYYDDNYDNDAAMQPSFFKERYINAILPGAFIGGIIGLLCALLDKKFPDFWPLTWLCLGIEREAIIQGLCSGVHHDVYHKKSLMESSSFLTAWVAYLIACDHLRDGYRF